MRSQRSDQYGPPHLAAVCRTASHSKSHQCDVSPVRMPGAVVCSARSGQATLTGAQRAAQPPPCSRGRPPPRHHALPRSLALSLACLQQHGPSSGVQETVRWSHMDGVATMLCVAGFPERARLGCESPAAVGRVRNRRSVQSAVSPRGPMARVRAASSSAQTAMMH